MVQKNKQTCFSLRGRILCISKGAIFLTCIKGNLRVVMGFKPDHTLGKRISSKTIVSKIKNAYFFHFGSKLLVIPIFCISSIIKNNPEK